MPKLGAEPIRKSAIVNAAIQVIGESGRLDVTVSQIAKRAGMSSALAHHYFGSKEDILLAAMRHVLRLYAAEVLARLRLADSPRARIEAILRGSFTQGSFQREAIVAWLNFWVMALSVPAAAQMMAIYRRRLRSNLLVGLRPLAGEQSGSIAASLGALIDGVYLGEVMRAQVDAVAPDGERAITMVLDHLDAELARLG